MDIKKVITDKYYEKKYISIKDNIYEVEYYKNFHPDLASEVDAAILKNDDEKLKPTYNLIKAEYKPFPSNDKMIEIMQEKKCEIYNKLGLNSIVGENAPIIKAMMLYEYLCKNNKYDMTVQEDNINNKDTLKTFSKFDEYDKKIKQLQEEHQLEYEKLKFTQTLKETIKIKNSINKILNEIAMIDEEIEEFNDNLFDSIVLKAIYNTLIYNKGVCLNFSFAYQFLLEGSGISTYSMEIINENGIGGHIYNIIEVMKDEYTPKYYIVDSTYGNSKKHKGVVEIIESFAINKEKYFEIIKDKKLEGIKILTPLRKNSKNILKNLEPEPFFSAMCEKMEDITSLTKAKQQAIKLILEYDIIKPIENRLER